MKSIHRDVLARMLELLVEDGYGLVGPTRRDGAIVYDRIDGAGDLPRGYTDEQKPGFYRVHKEGDAYFGYVVGPQSWKRFMAPPRERLVQLRTPGVAEETTDDDARERLAFIGLRACELASDEVLGRVYSAGPHVDRRYAQRRDRRFVVAVNCLEPGGLCFCSSMGTGPRVDHGHDVCLTEMGERFVIETGSDRGAALVQRLDTREATRQEARALRNGLAAARSNMGRSIEPRGLPDLLHGNLDHPRWDEVAARCLSCGNCTQVCPTCFCHAMEHSSAIGDDVASVERRWDSCFTVDHSYIHGGRFRPTTRDRYRQWLTHKFSSWVSQFATSGCVGCGRCIAWCPVGIDITEELQAIAADPAPAVALPQHEPPEMIPGDPLTPVTAHVTAVKWETRDVATLHLEPSGPFRHQPGQFNMLSLPSVGEPPISISGQQGSTIAHTIRAVGASTRALCNLRPGDAVGLRGPFGKGWPVQQAQGHNVMVIAGGIGLAPLRGALRQMVARPDLYPSVRLLYGARTPADILYDDELLGWNRDHAHFKASVSVDHAREGWNGHVGFVTNLIRRKETSPHGVYMLCGPEVMMRACIGELLADGVPPSAIYLSMERNMHCAAGFCGRCQYGPFFVCKDGPVFRYDQVSFLFGRAGI